MHICNHNNIVRIHYFFFPVLSHTVVWSVRLKAHTGPPTPLCLIFLCRHNARHYTHHLQTPGAPWPAQRQWHRRHRTHCSACAGRTLSGKPGISFIERHDHLAKCSCPTWPSNQQLSPIRRASAHVGLARQSKRARSMFTTASRQLIVLSENNAHWNNAKTTHDACGGLPC